MNLTSESFLEVTLRCRPLSSRECSMENVKIVNIESESQKFSILDPNKPSEAPKAYNFNALYDENVGQSEFYNERVFGLMEQMLNGYDCAIFTYGQTACGKSYTLHGTSTRDENTRGIIPRAFSQIFESIQSETSTSSKIQFRVQCSFLELYNEQIVDLLADINSQVKCELKENPKEGIFVKGLSNVCAKSESDLLQCYERGINMRNNIRANTPSVMNILAHRSHSFFAITIEKTIINENGQHLSRTSKITFADLAGRERTNQVGCSKVVMKQVSKINLSLSTLNNVIAALSSVDRRNIPFRDSKLTRLLQESLYGNCKTLMIAVISPADCDYKETMQTLRYARDAMKIRMRSKVNKYIVMEVNTSHQDPLSNEANDINKGHHQRAKLT